MSRRIPRILLGLYLVVLAYLCFWHFSSMPPVPMEILGIPTDKIVHFCMFLPFPLLVYWSFDWPGSRWWHSLLLAACILVVGSILAYGTEFCQGLTEYREYDPLDFLADVIGLGVSSTITFLIDLSKHRKHVR